MLLGQATTDAIRETADVVNTFGFSLTMVAMLIAMVVGFVVDSRLRESRRDKQLIERDRQSAERETKLGNRLDEVETYARDVLGKMVGECQVALRDNTQVMREVKDCLTKPSRGYGQSKGEK